MIGLQVTTRYSKESYFYNNKRVCGEAVTRLFSDVRQCTADLIAGKGSAFLLSFQLVAHIFCSPTNFVWTNWQLVLHTHPIHPLEEHLFCWVGLGWKWKWKPDGCILALLSLCSSGSAFYEGSELLQILPSPAFL